MYVQKANSIYNPLHKPLWNLVIIDHDGSEMIVIVDHLQNFLLPLDWVFLTMVDGTSIQHVALLLYVTNNM